MIESYLYIDRLLDSSIPHDLLNEYSTELEASAFRPIDVPDTIDEESPSSQSPPSSLLNQISITGSYGAISTTPNTGASSPPRVPAHQKRTPKDIFRSSEDLPLLQHHDETESLSPPPSVIVSEGPQPNLPWLEDAEVDSDDPIVTFAIWINLIANAILLAGKIFVIMSVPSMSVLASLVDAVLDLLSTLIVWVTTHAISSSQKDQHSYPVGRRK